MNRRRLGLLVALALGFLAAPLAAAALPGGRIPRIGVLSLSDPPSAAARERSPFWHAMHELGWVEGQNISVERRSAAGRANRLPALAAELVRLPVDVIIVQDSLAIRAAKHATAMIPIVMLSAADPVAMGDIASLAPPGGNIPGSRTGSQQPSGRPQD